LAGGEPINPYLKGQLWWWLVDQTRPKEPWVPMGTNVGEVDELEMEFLESTSVRNWMEMWLRALSDHVRIVSDMSTPLLAFLELPMVVSSPYRSDSDCEVQRFGLIWKLYTPVYLDVVSFLWVLVEVVDFSTVYPRNQ